MAKISFQKAKPPIEVETGANLMKSLLGAGLPVASSCDGDGVCAKCRIQILEGRENLSPETELELFLKEKNKIAKDMRISCQTAVNGDIKVDATYW
ncbi:2Fe-2S iron-sulfur cluster-binding protein [Bdellovibrio sp. HCB2-146]|uniref:2Fe-2S iron-sulfur cluster-binding protein n=1 Tax=Bdellovibrio sp. HCB2-146 TaxID=3394362 RepID=UPI0039BC27CB